jgi:two-component system, cell cycle response regulator
MTESNDPKGNILLIDDLPENLQLLSELLIKLGYHVRSVTSGKMALRTLKIKPVDVIFLDIKMPEMDGYEVCQAIKSDRNLREIPIIFISTLDDTFDKVKAFQSGGVDYITKPFQIEEVIARLENQLTIQRQKKKLREEIKKRQDTEEILYQSRALISSVLNTALDGIASFQAVRDPVTGKIEDFRCLILNPIIAKFFHRSTEQLLGKLVFKKFISQINPHLFEQFVNVVETGKPLIEDIYYPLEDSYWYHFFAVKLGDGFAVTVKDITENKKLELQLKEANQKLTLLVNLDGLTKISNRHRFDECLYQKWQEHYKAKQTLSLILIDLDYFKFYNEHYGHQKGDSCLIKIAYTINQIIPKNRNLLARFGGEEFGVILPNTDLEKASTVAENIRKSIVDLNLPHEQSEISQFITVSLGVASMIPTLDNSLEELINQADQALYQAKKQGRNRVILAS